MDKYYNFIDFEVHEYNIIFGGRNQGFNYFRNQQYLKRVYDLSNDTYTYYINGKQVSKDTFYNYLKRYNNGKNTTSK